MAAEAIGATAALRRSGMTVPRLAERCHVTERQAHAFLLTEDARAMVGLTPRRCESIARAIAEAESAAV